jgi:hypothetical protein
LLIYVAVIVFDPTELNLTIQLPVPFTSVIEQFVFAPETFTVPLGVVVPPITLTKTVTF